MFSHKGALALTAAATLLSVVSAQTSSSSSILLIPTPTKEVEASAIVSIGCFKTSTPLDDHGPYKYQSEGNCQRICIGLEKDVMGLSDGTNCWCGDLIPGEDARVRNETCDTTCAGTDEYLCGGPSLLWVDLTGFTRNRVGQYSAISSSSSAASTSSAEKTSKSVPTALVSESAAPEKEEKDSGPNKVGIAVGVVVGVLALLALIGGVVFYLRHKRRREVEEEYRRQAAVNSFVSGGSKLHTSNSSMTDSRLDPEFMNRRQSNGSIADNEDYSRRILKVTNA